MELSGAAPTVYQYIEICAQCEDIAGEIWPSYKDRYADMSAMFCLPEDLKDASIDLKYAFMARKKISLEKLKSAIGLSAACVASTASVSASGQRVSAPDTPFELRAKRVTEIDGTGQPGRKRRRPKTRGPLVESQSLVQQNVLEALSIDEILNGIEASQSAVGQLRLTLSQHDSVRNRQLTYLAFGLFVTMRTNAAVNGVHIINPFNGIGGVDPYVFDDKQFEVDEDTAAAGEAAAFIAAQALANSRKAPATVNRKAQAKTR